MLKIELVKEIMRLREELENLNEEHKNFMVNEYFAGTTIIKDIVSVIPIHTETGIFANYYSIRFKNEKFMMKLKKNQLEEILENMPLMIKEVERWLEIHKFELERHKELTKETEPELVAISTKNSKGAEILKDKISPMDKMIDIQGVKINLNDKVVDVYNDEIAKVIELSQNENKVRIQYIGDENYLNGEILECSPNELEIIA